MPVKICAVTSTRADYGILSPLLKKLREDDFFDFTLAATGTHLSDAYGHTVEEILRDGFRPVLLPILKGEIRNATDVSRVMAESLLQFSAFFAEREFDLLLVLGDRYEIAAICCAAVNCRLPIAHLHGGETTEGAIDECYRHAITKMSWLHFPAAEAYRRRIIQLGEDPERVFNVGALAVENIREAADYPLEKLAEETGLPLREKNYAVVTFHPVTQEEGTAEGQMRALLEAMDGRRDLLYLITKSNADEGGGRINAIWDEYGAERENCRVVSSLGMRRYLSAVKHSLMALGNSSSGILEAPVCGVPTVNIGERQKGRLRAGTVIDCRPERDDILAAMNEAERRARQGMKPDPLFGDGTTSERILRILKEKMTEKPDLKKKFLDLPGMPE